MIDPRVMVRIADEIGFVVKRVELLGEGESGFGDRGAVLIKQPIRRNAKETLELKP
jgi:hypothetical protein